MNSMNIELVLGLVYLALLYTGYLVGKDSGYNKGYDAGKEAELNRQYRSWMIVEKERLLMKRKK